MRTHEFVQSNECEDIRKNLEPARRRLAGLKSAIWAAAKKCAENSP